jgi:hypothetical protein
MDLRPLFLTVTEGVDCSETVPVLRERRGPPVGGAIWGESPLRRKVHSLSGNPIAVPDLDAVLLNVEERNKWQQRVATLERQRAEIRRRRTEIQEQLRKLRRELSELQQLTRSVNASRSPALFPTPTGSDEVRRSSFGLR